MLFSEVVKELSLEDFKEKMVYYYVDNGQIKAKDYDPTSMFDPMMVTAMLNSGAKLYRSEEDAAKSLAK